MSELSASYYVETLTDQLEAESEDIFRQVDAIGGVVTGIEAGWFQQQIASSALQQQREVESGQRVIVGVNELTEGSQKIEIDVLKIDPQVEAWQRTRLARLRKTRDQARVDSALAALEDAARSSANLVPHLLECARSYSTL